MYTRRTHKKRHSYELCRKTSARLSLVSSPTHSARRCESSSTPYSPSTPSGQMPMPSHATPLMRLYSAESSHETV